MSLNNLILVIIAIVLISIIILAILYKINKDNNTEENNLIENFETEAQRLAKQALQQAQAIENNTRINALINKILTDVPTPSKLEEIIGNTNSEIDNKMQDAITRRIDSSTNNMINSVNSKDIIIKKNITKLSNQVTDLENMLNKLQLNEIKKQNFSKIKSLNNGVELVLLGSKNTNYIDKNTGILTNGYMVNMNKGCLSVSATDYNIYKCNDKNRKQLFKMEHVINEEQYEKNFEKAIPYDTYDKKNIKYPFVMIKSLNNNNCLTNQNGNITVQPCYTFKSQRWIPL